MGLLEEKVDLELSLAEASGDGFINMGVPSTRPLGGPLGVIQ